MESLDFTELHKEKLELIFENIDILATMKESDTQLPPRFFREIIDSNYTEVNSAETDLEVEEKNYDLSVLQETEYKDLYEYRYIEIEKDGKAVIIKRPFFKDLDSVEKYFKALKEFGNLKYAFYQYERGENGTPHIQGFIIYKNSKRFKNVKQDFPTAHIQVPNGSNIENRDYCTKKDTRIAEPVKLGEFSEMRSRNDIVQFI